MPPTPPADTPPAGPDESVKRPYHAPELQDLGSIAEVTSGGPGGDFDGGGYSS
jgi:hypothetical protein